MPHLVWILALSAAFASALNGTMVMPVLAMALGRIPGIDDTLATVIGSAEIAGIALYCLFLPRLARRWRRQATIGGIAALMAGEALTHVLSGAAPLAAARLLAGLGEGAIFNLVAIQLASAANAEQLWGQINLIGGSAMGFLLFGLSLLPPAQERGPIFLCLAAFAAAMAPLILLMRRPPSVGISAAASAPLHRRHVGLALVMVFLVYGVQAGEWAVSGYLGARMGMPQGTIGLYLAISSIAGFVGALLPTLTRNPARRLPGVSLGIAIMGVSLYCFFNIHTPLAFLLGQVFGNIGFYMATPYVSGLLTENDADGALLMRTLIVALFGAASGTAAAGEMLDDFGPSSFSLALILILAATLLSATAIFKRAGLTTSRKVTGEAVELPVSLSS